MPEPLQVVGLGMSTLDVLVRLEDMPLWDGDFSRITDFALDGGGPVATAMVAAARLGARAGFIGTTGNDSAAQLKTQSLRDNAVDLSRLVCRDAPEDQVFIVYVQAKTGERVFAGLNRLGDNVLRVADLDREYITGAQYLHLDGYHAEAALEAARWAREAGSTVVFDGHKTDGPVPGHVRTLVKHVDVLISGSGFARGLTGVDDIWEAGAAVLEMGPHIFVQTEGERGSYTVTATERFHTPTFDVAVEDTTGAGDVFHGAFIVGMLHGWDLRKIVLFSSATSAIKCTKLGGRAGIPRFEEVIAFLRARGIELD